MWVAENGWPAGKEEEEGWNWESMVAMKGHLPPHSIAGVFLQRPFSAVTSSLSCGPEWLSTWRVTQKRVSIRTIRCIKMMYNCFCLGQWLTHCRWLSGRLGSSWCQRQTCRGWTEKGPQTIPGSLGGIYGWKQQSLFPWPVTPFERPDTENKRAGQKLIVFHLDRFNSANKICITIVGNKGS